MKRTSRNPAHDATTIDAAPTRREIVTSGG